MTTQHTNNYQQGFIKWILILVIGLIIASYFFDFNLQTAIEDEQTQSNFSYLQTHIVEFYDDYLREPIDYFWNEVILKLINTISPSN